MKQWFLHVRGVGHDEVDARPDEHLAGVRVAFRRAVSPRAAMDETTTRADELAAR
ncbi:MAG TPA: hypothetical protein VFG44_04200 [Burkholderiales bacterium]|jgi:hypothetical protein|nr:hypothetical protein [Burkholderiales bacterium]